MRNGNSIFVPIFADKFEGCNKCNLSQLSISRTVNGPTNLFETSRVRLIEYSRYRDSTVFTFIPHKDLINTDASSKFELGKIICW